MKPILFPLKYPEAERNLTRDDQGG